VNGVLNRPERGKSRIRLHVKSMGRQVIKIVTLFVEQIKSKVKPLIVILPPDVDLLEKVLTPLLTRLSTNSDSYFLDTKQKIC
jgi:hypothetical protein